MKKFFTLLLAVISTMTALAQTEPAIELQAEVDGNTRHLPSDWQLKELYR